MALRITSLFMVLFLVSGCFKTDIFDYDEKESFFNTDFYQNDLKDFNLVIQDIQLFDPQPVSLFGDTSYAYSITYGMEESFYNDLRQNWDQEIILSRTVNSQLKIYREHLVDGTRLLFTDTIGRKELPFTASIRVALIVKTTESNAVMARVPRQGTIEAEL